jgi:rRNA maturation endonuclease Nob1
MLDTKIKSDDNMPQLYCDQCKLYYGTEMGYICPYCGTKLDLDEK